MNVFRQKNLLFKDWKEKNNNDGTAFIIIPFQELLKYHCIVQYNSNIIADFVKKNGYKKPRKNNYYRN